MKLICVFCVLFLSLNEVYCSPRIHPYQEGLVTTRDAQIKVDENMAKILQRLFTLESKFSAVTDPDMKENFRRRFDSFETEISVVSQDIYHGAMGVCLGSDTFPGDIAPCSRNPMSYITEKFAPLFKRIEEFEVECLLHLSKDKDLNKESGSPEKLSNQEELVTTRDAQIKVDENMAKILQRLFTLESKFYWSTNPNYRDDFKRRFDSFEVEISVVSLDIYNGAMGLCVGSDTFFRDVAPCSRNPMKYITDKFAPLYRRIEEFELESPLYLIQDIFRR